MTQLTAQQLRRRAKKRWDHMFDRCYNPRCQAFGNYGGRGIKVCERWYEFEVFYADVGDPPSPELSIDRKDNDGNYEPGNWRWATAREQAMNSRSMPKTVIMDKGARISYAEAAERLGCSDKSVQKRLLKYRKRGVTEVTFENLLAGTNAAREIWGLKPVA